MLIMHGKRNGISPAFDDYIARRSAPVGGGMSIDGFLRQRGEEKSDFEDCSRFFEWLATPLSTKSGGSL